MRTESLLDDLGLTPEEQFIITCLRSEFSGSSDNFPAFDFKSFGWNRVYQRSQEWRIAPLLYKSMEKRVSLINTLNISKRVTVQPPPLTPPTRGGEIDIGKFVQTGSCPVISPLMGEGKCGGELFPKDFLGIIL
ncbi:MAG: hypothetical protein HS132_00290 [Planctomycetia bacterium]|nr:hypothetical protein [Planctomycetia bacterium]